MLNMLCIHVCRPMASHFCETANSMKTRPVSPVFLSWASTDMHPSDPSGKEDNSPEDENTGCNQRVGQKRPNGHHVHEGLQVKKERHHSYWGKEKGVKKRAVRKFQTADAKSEISDGKFFVLVPMISQVKHRKCISHS